MKHVEDLRADINHSHLWKRQNAENLSYQNCNVSHLEACLQCRKCSLKGPGQHSCLHTCLTPLRPGSNAGQSMWQGSGCAFKIGGYPGIFRFPS